MSKTLKYWALALCPALLAISCEKEATLEDETPAQPQKVFRTITLEFPDDPETRVSLAADGKTAWEAGDEILIHGQKMGHSGEEYYSRVVTLAAGDIKDEGKTATFTFEDIVADKSWGRTGYKTNLFAAYPASALSDYSNSDSWYYTSSFKNTNTLLLAGCNDTSVNGGNTFKFINLSGALSFVVDGDFDSYVFQGKGGETVGYTAFSVRVDTESTFGDKNDIPHSSGSGKLTSGPQTFLSGSVTADGSTVNYIYFPGGVNLSTGFTIRFLKGGDVVKYVSTSSARNIARGKYLKLGDITSHLKTYVPPTSHEATAPAIAGATDLSDGGTANCYVVNAGDEANKSKVFKFKAVKGNSSVNVGAISSVEVLWETWNDGESVTKNSVVAAVDYDKQDENEYYEICFQMPATLHAGNALIAAKNSGGTILWSWHIWVPASSVGSGKYGLSDSVVMQDRNLGALIVADKAVADSRGSGLFYQWGRKDPLRAVRSLTNSSFAKTYPSGVWTIEAKQATLDEARQNPTVMYTNETWTSDSYDGLWATTKTVNDPCPKGYKIPSNTAIFEGYFNPANYDAWGWGDYGFTAGTTGDGTTTFPYSGFAYYSSGDFDYFVTDKYIGTRLWTNVKYSDGKYRALDVKYTDSASNYSRSGTGQKMGSACAIRCVAE